MSTDASLLPLSHGGDLFKINNELSDIAQLVVERKVQFLCGAGMSKASGCPLASDLSEEMIKNLLGRMSSDDLKKLVGTYPFEAVAGAYLELKDPIRLKTLVRKAIDRGEGKIHAGHEALVYLFNQGYIDRLYTTNYDTLIESAFDLRQCTVTDDNAYVVHEARAQHKIPVIHLHGTLDSHKYLIAERDTYQLDTGLARLMMADMVTHWFIWVGYSLNDVDLRSLYLSMRDMLARTDDLIKKPYVIHPLTLKGTAQEDEFRIATNIWKARGATFIPMYAEQFLPMLLKYIRRIEGDSIAKKLATKRGLNPSNEEHIDEIWQNAHELSQSIPLNDDLKALMLLAQREGVEVNEP